MILKLTKGNRVLDEKMKSQIFGGDCASQCADDCASDTQIQSNQNGDAEGKKIGKGFSTY